VEARDDPGRQQLEARLGNPGIPNLVGVVVGNEGEEIRRALEERPLLAVANGEAERREVHAEDGIRELPEEGPGQLPFFFQILSDIWIFRVERGEEM
jgi:hypothetical protein